MESELNFQRHQLSAADNTHTGVRSGSCCADCSRRPAYSRQARCTHSRMRLASDDTERVLLFWPKRNKRTHCLVAKSARCKRVGLLRPTRSIVGQSKPPDWLQLDKQSSRRSTGPSHWLAFGEGRKASKQKARSRSTRCFCRSSPAPAGQVSSPSEQDSSYRSLSSCCFMKKLLLCPTKWRRISSSSSR